MEKRKGVEIELRGVCRNFGVQSEDGLQLLGRSWHPTETPIVDGAYIDDDPLPRHCKLTSCFDL